MEASESRLSGMGAEGLDQADSEQMDVSIRYLELWDSIPMCTECSRTDVFWS